MRSFMVTYFRESFFLIFQVQQFLALHLLHAATMKRMGVHLVKKLLLSYHVDADGTAGLS